MAAAIARASAFSRVESGASDMGLLRPLGLGPSPLHALVALNQLDAGATDDVTDRRAFAVRNRLQLTPQVGREIDAERRMVGRVGHDDSPLICMMRRSSPAACRREGYVGGSIALRPTTAIRDLVPRYRTDVEGSRRFTAQYSAARPASQRERRYNLIAMTARIAALFATILALAIAPTTTALDRVSIYVGPQTREGFVDMDSGVRDSIDDIQKELKRSDKFQVVSSAADARIVLVVVGRRISGAAGAVGVTTPGVSVGGTTVAGVQSPVITTPGVTTMVSIDRRAIDTILRVGTYEKTITSEGSEGGSWSGVAKAVVKDITAWVDANRAALTR